MRFSQMLIPTLREVPAEAEVISHKLLLRAGFIRKAAAGVYTYLPLAQRVLRKIMEIVREEMNAAGGEEVMLPIIQPAELWQESGRWDVYGDEMFRLKDRHGRNFCLGPTHEEIITDLIRNEVRSHKQLPMRLYQIQNKYRDERRPRFGLLRGREFIMKDLYSFDKDEAGLEVSYQLMYQAYKNIFSRCGLEFRAVEADSGAIGGNESHEFMVLADAGEAEVVYCNACDFAANTEKAKGIIEKPDSHKDMKILEEVATPQKKSVEEVAEFLNIPLQHILKTMIFVSDEKLVAVVVRGDRKINNVKIQNTLGSLKLDLASEALLASREDILLGFVGPHGLNMPIIADEEVKYMINAVAGANKADFHLINVNPSRDFSVQGYYDLREVEAGEPCPHCGQALTKAQGIEVGQVFKLGTKYSKAFHANYLDTSGKEQPIIMGCYGVGVSRTMAAAIEQNYDENGIIWPVTIAPYHAVVIPVNNKDVQHIALAEKVYEQLKALKIETVLDDRAERPGVKFKDADLIGFPVRITIGNKAINEGLLEIRVRATAEEHLIPLDGLNTCIQSILFPLETRQ